MAAITEEDLVQKFKVVIDSVLGLVIDDRLCATLVAILQAYAPDWKFRDAKVVGNEITLIAIPPMPEIMVSFYRSE